VALFGKPKGKALMPADAAVASVPYPNDRPHYAWVPPGGAGWEKLFVVQIPSGIRKITADNYLNFLSDRLAWMARKSGDPENAMREIEKAFLSQGLLHEAPPASVLGIFTISIIALNPGFSQHAAATLGPLPVILTQFSPASLVTLSRVNMQEWLQELVKWGRQLQDKKPRAASKNKANK
jgi:hypothetical protein